MGKRWAFVAGIAILALSSALGPLAGESSAVAPGSAVDVNWPQYHGRPTHEGYNKREQVVGVDNVSSLSLSWIGNGSTSREDLVYKSSPTVVDGFVYFGTVAGQVLVFPAGCSGDCEPAWRLDLGQGIYNTPAVVNGVLYVGTASPEGRFYAFDVARCAKNPGCRPLWTAKMAVGESSPTVSQQGVVYVGSQQEGLYAFSAAGCGKRVCQPLWVGQTDGYVNNSPAVLNGQVYVGDHGGYLDVFDAHGCDRPAVGAAPPTCTPMWRGRAAASIESASPVVHGGMVYTTSFAAAPDSFLEVFPAAGCGTSVCRPLWRGTGGSYLNSAPAVAYGRVYLGSGDGQLLVYDAKGCGKRTCGPSWTGTGSGPVATMESAPMVANGVVYAGGNNQRVRAWDARGCGQFQCTNLWEFVTQDPLVNSSPVMVNGTLYVSGTNFGTVPELYVFNLP
jgi:eukaryotic-like serine/threonine-protein kinase